MARDHNDNAVEQPQSSSGLASERAASIAVENQGHPQAGATGPSGRGSGDVVAQKSGSDSLLIPKLELSKNGGPDQINDCSKEKCMVKGTQYKDSTEIPGNKPVPLLHPDGKPVLGPDGKPVFGPDRVDLEKIAADVREHKGMLSLPQSLLNFRHSGAWDFQRVQSDDGKPIWTEKYQQFSNIAIGYLLSAQGLSFERMTQAADVYCRFKCNYDEPRSKDYPNLADRQVKDIKIGVDLYRERHPEGR